MKLYEDRVFLVFGFGPLLLLVAISGIFGVSGVQESVQKSRMNVSDMDYVGTITDIGDITDREVVITANNTEKHVVELGGGVNTGKQLYRFKPKSLCRSINLCNDDHVYVVN